MFTYLEEQIITNYVKILCDWYVNERFRKYDKHWENKENSEVLWERSEYYLSATALHFSESVTPDRIRARAVIDHRFTSGLHHAFDKKNSKYQVRIQTHENNKAVKESILKGVFSFLSS